MPVPRSSASARASLSRLLGCERQPLDADVDLDAAVRGAVRLLEGRLVVVERVEVVLVVGDVVREHRADADLLGGAASASSRRYMSLTVVTPHLIDSL